MGQSNGKRNLWVVDSLASNNNSDIIIDDVMAYDTAKSITSGNQIVYRDWVLAQLNNSPFNKEIIDFTTSGGTPNFTLSNYNTDYFPLFGNNPGLAIYTFQGGVEQQDLQTAPIINRVTPGDRSSDITSIVWPYPIATAGYLMIDGFSGLSSSVVFSSISLNYADTDLISDGAGGYYLPLTLPIGTRPFYAESNGIENKSVNYDNTTSPARLYGFPNNTPTQVILIKIS